MRQIERLRSDYLLVQLEPERKRTKGGIIIPDTKPEPVRIGIVLMAGPGRQYTDRFIPMEEDIIGRRVAFMIAASQTKQGQEIRRHLDLGNDQELIRLGDVLFIVDGEGEVTA